MTRRGGAKASMREYGREVSFDTNLLIRWILQDVPEQAEQVIAILKDPKVKEVHVADMVLAEVVWVLSSPRVGFDRPDVAELLGIVFTHPKVRYNQALMQRVLPLYTKYSAISFVDICLATYAELEQTQLLTFDKKLSRHSKHAQLVY